jgi:sterol desaturase/sphingolipid hydroxylase (fatty acid hydroxylase superfamily)
MNWLENGFGIAQQWLFEAVVQPLMSMLGMSNLLEDGYVATGWLLVGIVEIAVMLALIAPLQRWRPVESITDCRAVRTDVVYTLIHRLGLFRLALFFFLQPVFDGVFGRLHTLGVGGWHLDNVWPGVTDLPWLSFLLYLAAFDLADYWIHRGQHTWRWWWSLHSLHHAQRQMTMWSDNRNHLLDTVIHDSLLVVLAQCIGVGPGQFVAIVALTQLSESLQHANLRLSFGRWGERVWISPRFHRVHHSIGLGHEGRGKGTLGGHNFGVLLPWWDMLFGTVDFEHHATSTGVRDQVEKGRDYGRGFWSQQWLGLKRLAGRA